MFMRVCAYEQTRMSIRLLHTQCLDAYLIVKEAHMNQLSFNIRNSEYDQEIPQPQTAEKPMAPRGRATQQP